MNSSSSERTVKWPTPEDGVGQPLLVVDGVGKSFSEGPTPIRALQAVSLQVQSGEIVCLLGPSGSGKSTLLRIVGGLIRPDRGRVWFEGQPVQEPHPSMGFIFQSTNLMPWRTVLDNVLLPVEVQKGRVEARDREQGQELLALVGLDGFSHLYPRQLSGGMAQRVVLARTLLHGARLLLMDEPFGALDALTRERMNLELLRIHRLQAKTILMVTHSISEAVFLADRVLVMSERPGRIVAQLSVDLPRPRTIDMMAGETFGRLTLEVRRYIGEVGELD